MTPGEISAIFGFLTVAVPAIVTANVQRRRPTDSDHRARQRELAANAKRRARLQRSIAADSAEVAELNRLDTLLLDGAPRQRRTIAERREAVAEPDAEPDPASEVPRTTGLRRAISQPLPQLPPWEPRAQTPPPPAAAPALHPSPAEPEPEPDPFDMSRPWHREETGELAAVPADEAIPREAWGEGGPNTGLFRWLTGRGPDPEATSDEGAENDDTLSQRLVRGPEPAAQPIDPYADYYREDERGTT